MSISRKLIFKCFLILSFTGFLFTPSLANAALTDNLSGFWNLNETSGSRADSVGSNTLTQSGGTVSSAGGVVSNAALFSGSNYLSIADNAALSTGNIDFTIAGWIYMADKSTNRILASKWNSLVANGREWDLIYVSSLDRFVFTTSSDGTQVESGNFAASTFGSPSINTWYYVVAWHDSVNNTVNIQVNNGTVDSLSVTAGVFNSTTPFSIGSANGGAILMNGRIDAVGFWKRVLTAGERTSLYNSGSGLELTLSTAPEAISDLTAVRGNTKALLSWNAPSNGGSSITDYVIEYKAISDGSYTTFNDGISTATSTVVSSLANGTSYDFKVSAVNSVGTSTASNVASTTPQNSSYYSILVTGQSLSLGAFGTPALNTTQPYSNAMLNGSTLVPLIENYINTGATPCCAAEPTETINSAMANTITSLVGGSPDTSLVVSRNGYNGGAYSVIKKNGSASTYADGVSNITNIKNAVDSLSETYRVLATVLIHGEADNSLIASGGANTYANDISQLQSDYNTDLKAITSQSETIPMFTDQMMSFTGYGYATSSIPSAQLSASETNSNIHLVTPKYIFDYDSTGSQAHLVNTSYRRLGEYYGKVIKKVMIDGDDWTPLSPATITRNANIIYAQLNVPVSPIVIDTSAVLAKSNYGFEYADNSSSASISSVEIYNSDTVKITLNTTPTGSNQRLRYAYTGTANSRPGAQIAGSARGNIRDSDITASLYGNDLSNWLVSFDKAITVDQTAPTISSVSSSVTQTTATITWTTDESATSTVNYGSTDLYGTASSSQSFVTSHSITLTGLTTATTYHFQVDSMDAYGNRATSTDYTFTTASPDPSPTPTPTPQSVSSSSSGSSVQSRINNLNAMGNVRAAQELMNKYLSVQITNNTLSRNLTSGYKGADVKTLQQYLNQKGYTLSLIGPGSPGNETEFFGTLTRQALIRFQKDNNIYPPLGFFGPITRAFIVNSK